MTIAWVVPLLLVFTNLAMAGGKMQRLNYNHPGLVVDLGVGLVSWPVPMDADGDGDYDLIVSYEGKPSSGTYFFENRTGDTSENKFPVFADGARISRGYYDVTPSYVDGEVIVSVRNLVFPDFAKTGLAAPQASGRLQANVHPRRLRFNQWRYVDFDGDGELDLTIGVEDWGDYGWDNFGSFEPGYDDAGNWVNGSLHGLIYVLRNLGTTAAPVYSEPEKLRTDGLVIDGYGLPSQCFEDFDGDGDLDLITGEFLDGFTYYPNVGTRSTPEYSAALRLPFTMDAQISIVTAIDWDKDGDIDLVVGQEDGRVALVEHAGVVETDGVPRFHPPRFFRQEAGALKFGSLVTPVGVDWDGDGDDDIVAGNASGFIGFFENLAGPAKPPTWAAPEYLMADGEVIRIMAGTNGSVQGPSEAKWGYTALTVADWDGDDRLDLIVNSIWGKVVWFRNVGTRTEPEFATSEPINVQAGGAKNKPDWTWWQPAGSELVTQWHTTPVAYDWNDDGLMDLVMLDQDGYLSLFRRIREANRLLLLPPERIFVDSFGEPLKLSRGDNGTSGRRKLHLVDWDGDGRIDLLADDPKTSVRFYRNESAGTEDVIFKDSGVLDRRELARHTTSPTTVDWDDDGVPDLLVGAEDGRLYFMQNPRDK